ncbi:MAG: branched-chain amino acid ABC transporter permease [Gordonia polyisoprenivorans]|nr:branched-chain amino acid ABC transporter permease [Gordonia polyisoprenivorans]
MPTELANIIVGTITLGFVYGLIGLGFVSIYRSTGVMSFAQGSFMLIGAMVFYTFTTNPWHQSFIPGLIIMAALMFLAGCIVYRVVLGRILGLDPLTVSVATLGLSIVLQMIAFMVWGPSIVQYRSMLSFTGHDIGLNLRFNQVQLFTIVVGVVVTVGLMYLTGRTRVGLSMRAVAHSPALSAYTGINVRRLSTVAWGIGAATAGISGTVYGLATQVDPGSLPAIGLLAFPAMLLGGLDSIGGAVVGGFLLAAIQNVTQVTIGSVWQDVTSYGVLLIVLYLRPQGLFGSPVVTRL